VGKAWTETMEDKARRTGIKAWGLRWNLPLPSFFPGRALLPGPYTTNGKTDLMLTIIAKARNECGTSCSYSYQ
jgi:hypothetical protein